MSKIADLSSVDTIASVEVIDDMGGTFLDLHLKNGARLRIAAENDVVVYWADGSSDQNPHSIFFADMGSGHHTPGAPCSMLTNP